MTRNILYLLITAFLFVDCLLAQPLELSLDEAISAALKNNPDLLASRFEVDARQARISQANAVPNPDFVLFVEDFAGSGHFESFDNSQTTA
ncbi:MAG TPA: TolC family protein, partial [Acidobacteriota bacterium]|nr:TolC family protein [Acidobacteriota bacterium]